MNCFGHCAAVSDQTMTIYTSKGAEKKEEEAKFPEVVTEVVVKQENVKNEEALLPPLPPTVYRSRCCNACVLVIGLFLVLITVVFGGIYFTKQLAQRKFRAVRYYEYENDVYEPETLAHHGSHHKRMGHFEEIIEIDTADWKYEKIEVPDFEDAKRAVIMHDFEKNITAIVDNDCRRCFILPLNRSDVIPPKDFWNLVRSGYYLPDVVVIREEYRFVQPPLQFIRPLGPYIWGECHRFDTYRLEKHNPRDPIVMVKRAVPSLKELAIPSRRYLRRISIISDTSI